MELINGMMICAALVVVMLFPAFIAVYGIAFVDAVTFGLKLLNPFNWFRKSVDKQAEPV